ncbi:MFS transporter [Dactylosporangium sp. NBC_01737]|uniref:MFS transporter n=1 Tax=Dactylosporangium sp. NBC_01737 TaxID=2975959 RepID=UPI002E0DAF49|nr:MFS transporter [Dactylosporangium sp. NBC_01737]
MSLFRDRGFVAFLCVQTLSAFGDAFSFTAVPMLVLAATGSATAMGAVKGLDAVAAIVGGLAAGVIADRFAARRLSVLRVCDLARFALYGSIPLVWLLSEQANPPMWLLFVALPIAGFCSMVFQVTYVTVVPRLVPADRITEANGILYGAFSAAYLAGPALAGLLSGWLGPPAALGVDAVTFLLSAAGLSFVRLRTAETAPAEGTAPAEEADGEVPKWRGFAEGVRFLRGHPLLWPLTVLLTVLICCTTALDDVVVYHVKEDLHRSDSVVGLVLTAGVVGSMLASAVVARLRRRFGFGPVWIVAYTCCGVLLAGVGFAGGAVGVGVLVGAVMVTTGVAGIASMSLRQEVTPGPLLGRVTSAFWTLQLTLAPVGAVVLTFAAGHAGVRPTLAVAGVACSLTALAALMTPIRTAGRTR